MSALGQKQTFSAAAGTSLFDHLVGNQQKIARDCKTKCFCGLEIDSQLEFAGLFDG
jgi:hypothetical protein